MRALTVVVWFALSAPALFAQELSLKRELPKVAWPGCSAQPKAGDVQQLQRDEAERLATAANQASILGDNTAAVELLTRAAARDPSSDRIAYRLARLLESLQRRTDAVNEYCRYVALAPTSADAPEARQRIAALTDAGGFAVPAAAATAFESAITQYDATRLVDAEAALNTALEVVPDWADAIYNRGVVRRALGRQDAAAADLRRYLELNPGSADFDAVLKALGPAAPATPRYSASAAFATGLLVPGLGHFTIGRPVRGTVFLAAAAGTVAAGLLTRRVEVECLAPATNGRCPPGQAVREQVERPYLVPALGAAAVVGLIGAVDAFLGARKLNRRVEATRQSAGEGNAALLLPAVEWGANGARIDLIRLRF